MLQGAACALAGEKLLSDAVQDLLTGELVVINIGLSGFAEELAEQSVEVISLDWQPPAGGDPELADLLSKLGG